MAAAEKRAFPLRITPEVLAAVERLAAAELRSTNAQIEILLREALARRGALRAPQEDPGDRRR
jgi:hypothetical protein